MRRLIAIVLMLLLPLQSAWALVAMPCMGHLNLPQAVQAAQALALAQDQADAHEAHGHGAAAHAAHAVQAMAHGMAHDGMAHEAGEAAQLEHAGHDAYDAQAAHVGHAGHDAAALDPPAGGNDGAGTSTSPLADPCSGSAACMSLHSPPLAAAFDAGLPAPALPGWLPPSDGQRFSSVAPQRLQRPPIGLAA